MDGRPIRASKCAANGAKNTGSSSSASTRPNSAGNTNSSDGKIASHNVGWSLTVLSTMASIPSIPRVRGHPPGSAPSDPGSTRRLFRSKYLDELLYVPDFIHELGERCFQSHDDVVDPNVLPVHTAFGEIAERGHDDRSPHPGHQLQPTVPEIDAQPLGQLDVDGVGAVLEGGLLQRRRGHDDSHDAHHPLGRQRSRRSGLRAVVHHDVGATKRFEMVDI